MRRPRRPVFAIERAQSGSEACLGGGPSRREPGPVQLGGNTSNGNRESDPNSHCDIGLVGAATSATPRESVLPMSTPPAKYVPVSESGKIS